MSKPCTMLVTVHQALPKKFVDWHTGQRLFSATPLNHRTRRGQPCTLCSSKVYIAATYLEGMHTLENTFKALGNLADDAAAVHTMTIIEEQLPGAETLVSCCNLSAPCRAVHATQYYSGLLQTSIGMQGLLC